MSAEELELVRKLVRHAVWEVNCQLGPAEWHIAESVGFRINEQLEGLRAGADTETTP